MYILVKNMLRLYIFICDIILYEYKYMHVNTCKKKISICCMCVYLYIHNKYTQYSHIYYVNKNFYLGCDSLFDSTRIFLF